ncbi:hypothetical protein MTR_1g053290 [Medicago truncatula]|uniref:Uncharacterized protein n=1 Tax=Medicago truncatula TaxID=3880 RepID=A0A072VJN2_MEDTR|nr:hypothetical protein MTR_1g053290 [Medicago truncatula]
MHLVPTRASSPQHIEYNYTHKASSPQLKEQKLTGLQALNVKSKSSQGIKPSTSNEYAWTQQQNRWPILATRGPIFVEPKLENQLRNRWPILATRGPILSFTEQFRRLHDYSHELIRSNPHSTVQIIVQQTEQSEEGNEEEFIHRPLLPSFHRFYVCIDWCRKSFSKCRQFIGLDGCFLKGYYGGMILAAVGRDPNEQMLPNS